MIYRPVILRPCPPLSLPSTRHQWNNFMSTLQYTYLILLLKWAKKSQSAVFYPPGGDNHIRQMAVWGLIIYWQSFFFSVSVWIRQTETEALVGQGFQFWSIGMQRLEVYRWWRWGSIVSCRSVLFSVSVFTTVGQSFQFSSLGNWL